MYSYQCFITASLLLMQTTFLAIANGYECPLPTAAGPYFTQYSRYEWPKETIATARNIFVMTFSELKVYVNLLHHHICIIQFMYMYFFFFFFFPVSIMIMQQ